MVELFTISVCQSPVLCCIYIVYVVLYLYCVCCVVLIYSYTCMLCCISHSGKEEWLQPIARSLNYKSINQSERETVKRSEVDHTTDESLVSALRNPRPPKGTKNKQPALPRRQQQRPSKKQHTGKCASCGGDHARKTCRFISAKCHNCGKIGHIASLWCQDSSDNRATAQ